MADAKAGYAIAEIPSEFKDLRACLRCGLIKSFSQFYDNGCENCNFLEMHGNRGRIHECTTAHFEGTIALIDPDKSWVAKWQRISANFSGLYAIDVLGDLPSHYIELCESRGLEYKAGKKDK